MHLGFGLHGKGIYIRAGLLSQAPFTTRRYTVDLRQMALGGTFTNRIIHLHKISSVQARDLGCGIPVRLWRNQELSREHVALCFHSFGEGIGVAK